MEKLEKLINERYSLTQRITDEFENVCNVEFKKILAKYGLKTLKLNVHFENNFWFFSVRSTYEIFLKQKDRMILDDMTIDEDTELFNEINEMFDSLFDVANLPVPDEAKIEMLENMALKSGDKNYNFIIKNK